MSSSRSPVTGPSPNLIPIRVTAALRLGRRGRLMTATIRLDRPQGGFGRLRWAARDAWIVAQRDMTQWVREPQLIVWGLVFPITFVLRFAYLFGTGSSCRAGGATGSS